MAKRSQASKQPKAAKNVEALRHTDDKRLNIPTAEHQSVLEADQVTRREIRYPRNTDLDPQLVWRGKDYQDWSDLVVEAPPLYIQEKVHPKVLIDDLLKESDKTKSQKPDAQIDLFADFNGVAEGADRTDFYQHDQNWTNRMILGDSLQVMASLAEREGLRGKVQCIYIDPPYGIKFNSNFQWSTTRRDVKDGQPDQITREPEQVKAFRDTWRDGIHSYLTYLRDRLVVARDLLAASGSIFVQIGDENVHRLRALMDEVLGEENFKSEIAVTKSTGLSTAYGVINRTDYVLWYCRDREHLKVRQLYLEHDNAEESGYNSRDAAGRLFMSDNLTKPGPGQQYPVNFNGRVFNSGKRWWGLPPVSMDRVKKAGRLAAGASALRFRRYYDDYPYKALTNLWDRIPGAPDPTYVVQTHPRIVERCVLMTTDPGDLVLDPTCGSGTTAFVAEQWGRRWITVDTSRVALALARARVMGARYPYYVLADSPQGLRMEAEASRRAFADRPTFGNVRHGFVYDRVPHITLKSIANNAEVDVIWDEYQPKIQKALDQLNSALGGHKTPFRVTTGGREGGDIRFDLSNDAVFNLPNGDVISASRLVEWEVPSEPPADWPAEAKRPLADFWEAVGRRQKAVDVSITTKAEFEHLYDRPYQDPKTVRVAGPFTVESVSPHRTLIVDEHDELIDPLQVNGTNQTFDQMILDNLRTAGVQQAHKEGRIAFESLTAWPGEMVCAEGRYREGDVERRAAVFIGPEFGTVQRPDLVRAAREAGDGGFDVLIACAFNYEAHASEFNKLGRVPVLKARMNADLHMGGDLKPTGKANLFVVFGEPDIDVLHDSDGCLMVHVKGVDVFDPTTGEVRSDGADGIACWFIDTDYNEESFFVRQAYFLGQNDPYGALKITLRAEIDPDVWATLNKDVSRPFRIPAGGRIAVKVINHLGDEVMKVFSVS